jgi:hypothetical protein
VRPAFVRGLGLWTPGFRSAADWCEGKRDDAVRAPEASLLDGAVKRRASLVTRVAIEAFGQAARAGGADLARTASVWGTANGESTATVELLAMMGRGEGRLSPTRFHGSVHNTAAGCASIACGNERFSTTLSGGEELAGACLLEAMLLLDEGEAEVVLVLADETYAPPLGPDPPGAPLGLALHLAAEARGALARLSGLRFDAGGGPADPPDVFAGLAIAAALPLLELVHARGAATLALQRGPAPRWRVDVEPC